MFRTKQTTKYSRVHRAFLFCSAAVMGLALMPAPAKAQKRVASKADFCSHLGKTFQASSGAQMYCFGPQKNGPGEAAHREFSRPCSPLLSRFGERRCRQPCRRPDQLRSLHRRPIGNFYLRLRKHVVEAWNDATGFFAGCGSPNYKEELTGYGFSSNGGKSFMDLGGLPNGNCSNGSRWEGDPSVGTYSNSGFTYFYISSLYACSSIRLPSQTALGGVAVALSACQVTGDTLSCGQPTLWPPVTATASLTRIPPFVFLSSTRTISLWTRRVRGCMSPSLTLL